MSGWDELGREQDMAAASAVGYLEGMYDVAVVRKRSPSVDLWRPDGPAARAAAAIMANAVASFNEALVPVLRGVRREARALCKRLDPKWRRARIRALKRSRRNVETLKREGRCR